MLISYYEAYCENRWISWSFAHFRAVSLAEGALAIGSAAASGNALTMADSSLSTAPAGGGRPRSLTVRGPVPDVTNRRTVSA
jgi:hypothetical protein